MCRGVHGGHKIFNLRRAVVIKCLSAQLAQDEVEREIATAAARGRLGFAPTVTRYSVAQRWYEEDYVLGDPGAVFYGAQNAEFRARFHGEIVRILEQILRIEPPAPVRLGDYVDGLMSRLKTALERPRRAPGVGALVLKFAAEYLEDDLRAAADEIVLTAFSHGDLAAGNILRTNDRAIVIDWEAAGRRSILFDLYSYLFAEVHKRRAKTLPAEELDQAMRALQAKLTREPSRPLDVTRMADIYRRLFYLERLLILAERNVSDKRFSRLVMRTIEVFSQYETRAADRTPVDGRHDNTKGAGIHEDTEDRGSKYATTIVVGALLSLAAEPALASVLG
ncbi:MAG: phosphotransferase family protein [Gammaproteobacteria bacterium]